MLDLHTIAEFSRTNCVAICAFLVPANLVFAVLAIALTISARAASQVRWVVGLGCLCALTMVLHVSTWFNIGVVQAETFILLCLGTTCLFVNVWAIAHPRSMTQIGAPAIAYLNQRSVVGCVEPERNAPLIRHQELRTLPVGDRPDGLLK